MPALDSRRARSRRRAFEARAPELSDEDVFARDHLLDDRSRLPVAAYLRELIRRDAGRAAGLILGRSTLGPKTGPAFAHELHHVLDRSYAKLERATLHRAVLLRSRMDRRSALELLLQLSLDLGAEGPDRSPVFEDALRELAAEAIDPLVRLQAALWLVAGPDPVPPVPENVRADAEAGVTARRPDLRTVAAMILIPREDADAWVRVRRTALRDSDEFVRLDVLTEVVRVESVSSIRMKRLAEEALLGDPSLLVRAAFLEQVLDRRGGALRSDVVLCDDVDAAWIRTPYGPGRHDPWLLALLGRMRDRDPAATLRRAAAELLEATPDA